ncbi:MAG: hypothetical protein ACRCWI_03425 [Brevinema sp.]
MIKNLIFILIFTTACNVDTGSTNLADEVYLATIFGQYRLSQAGADVLNNSYFATSPMPLYTIQNIFYIDNHGMIGVYSGDNDVVLDFVYAIQNNVTSAVYMVELPAVSNAGLLIKDNRYFKITLDNATNLIFSSQYADTREAAASLTVDYIFASPSY